ncbi:fatty acid desaturase [Phytopseudomonas daroniae]|nr:MULTISPECIES: fatty acid desaturase [Pseudomonas]
MRVLPKYFQPFLSWLTAKPLAEDLGNVRKLTPMFHVAVSVGFISLGVMLLASGYIKANAVMWALGFILASGGIKQFQVMICHNCAHDMVFTNKKLNALVGNLISGFLMLKPFEVYKKEHLLHHSSKSLLTDKDDTLSYLQGTVGLKPSDSVFVMWAKLVTTALSPLAILRSSWGRVKSTATAPNKRIAALTLSCWSIASVIALFLGQFDVFIIAWVLPVFMGYHISSTFRLAAEHTWPSVEVLEKRGVEFICESTTGVFIGEALYIKEDAGLIKRVVWISLWLLKMLTVHLFVRIFIMVGDTPCHDFHHRRPRSTDWPNYITARERDMLDGSKPFPSNYVGYWGYGASVTRNFRNFQRARPYYEKATSV